MRSACLLLLVACSRPVAGTADAALVDVMSCARAAPRVDATCAAGGLAGVDLAGTWTLTGTVQTNGAPPQPYVTSIVFQLGPDGWCDQGTARSIGPDDNFTYVDDDHVYHYDHSCNGYPCESSGYTTWFACKRASDGALYYSDQFNGIRMDMPATYSIVGTLGQ